MAPSAPNVPKPSPAYLAKRSAGVETGGPLTPPVASSVVPSPMSPFKSAELSEGELQQLYEFRCQDARCFKQADRAYVMAAIVEEFGSEAAFD